MNISLVFSAFLLVVACLLSVHALPTEGDAPVHAAVMPRIAADVNATNTSCAARIGCSNCTDDDSCVWCDSDNLCKNGNWYGPDGEIVQGCSDWRWKQCKVNGKAVFWSAVAIAGLLVLTIIVCGLCCLYCCCFRRRRGYQKYFDVEEDSRVKEREDRRREGEARRNALYNKYGTPEERAKMQLEEYNKKSYYSPTAAPNNKRSSIFTSN